MVAWKTSFSVLLLDRSSSVCWVLGVRSDVHNSLLSSCRLTFGVCLLSERAFVTWPVLGGLYSLFSIECCSSELCALLERGVAVLCSENFWSWSLALNSFLGTCLPCSSRETSWKNACPAPPPLQPFSYPTFCSVSISTVGRSVGRRQQSCP